MELIQDKQKTAYKTLKDECGWKNVMQTPHIEKVVVSVGTGKMGKDKHRIEVVTSRLARITGQKAVTRGAKKSIATFKTRIGDPIGYQVTLRGARARDFVNRLINVALPRTKDFKGISATAIDDMGNYTLGIKEHSIFPEAADEDIKDVFGLAITIVTSAHNKKDAKAYLAHLGFPFKK
ncbi:MAG TPA: 50S ribosomal protein L5 [Candidatus Paceibacterota bacterium]